MTYSGQLTHISGHTSATGRAQDGERTLARDWRSTAEPRGPRVTGGSYEHCDEFLTNYRYPLSTPGCSKPLNEDTLRSLVHQCDGHTDYPVVAGRTWSPSSRFGDQIINSYDTIYGMVNGMIW